MKNEKSSNADLELLLFSLDNSIEKLKAEFNLFFSGEIRVPPEQEREKLEKKIRNIFFTGQKNPRVALLIQNVSSKFTLYNNMWLKRLNELESGIVRGRVKPKLKIPSPPPKKNKVNIKVSLNSEDSFEDFYEQYKKLTSEHSTKTMDKEKMINTIKTKLITSNLIDVNVELKIENKKLKLKIKKQKFD